MLFRRIWFSVESEYREYPPHQCLRTPPSMEVSTPSPPARPSHIFSPWISGIKASVRFVLWCPRGGPGQSTASGRYRVSPAPRVSGLPPPYLHREPSILATPQHHFINGGSVDYQFHQIRPGLNPHFKGSAVEQQGMRKQRWRNAAQCAQQPCHKNAHGWRRP